jgi:uncharacterized membrane protein YccC
MRNFILGALCGLLIGSAVSVFAQLYPYDAPLAQRLQAEQMQFELQRQWQLDMERDPLMDKKPCR